MNIDDQLGLPEILGNTLVLTLEALDLLHRRIFAIYFPGCKCVPLKLTSPAGERRVEQTFAPQQSADFSGALTLLSFDCDPFFVLA